MTSIVNRLHCVRTVIQATILLALPSLRPAIAERLGETALRQSLTVAIEQHPASKRSSICLKVIDLETSEVLFDRRSDQLMTPASNLKIYTGACALEQFGPEHRFQTRLSVDGTRSGKTLEGDIVIVGGGDPMISSADLKRMAASFVDEFEIESVVGDVRVDNSRYGSPLKGPGWMWDDEPYYFNMSITPMMVDFNVLAVRVDPSSNSAQLALPSAYPPVIVNADEPGDKLRVTRRPFSDPIIVSGMAGSNVSSEHQLTMHDPGQWVAGIFKEMLRSQGMDFQSVAEDGKADSPHQAIRPRTSSSNDSARPGQSLHTILDHFQEESENAIGEVLLHEIAIATGASRPTWRDGAGAISNWLTKTVGLESDSFRLVDGSGLSRYNLISADSSVRLLQYMHRSKHAKAFVDSLPIYEIELDQASASSFDSKSLKNQVHAKGGSMSGVSTCSGYVRTHDDHWLAFSYLTNGFVGKSDPQKELRNEIWAILVRYRADSP